MTEAFVGDLGEALVGSAPPASARKRVLPSPPAAVARDRTETASCPERPAAKADVPLLEVKDLFVTYENQKTGERTEAVSGVGLRVAPGEFVTVVGLSGCGKSSFLSAVAGLTKPSSGSITVAGERVTKPGPDRAVVFQKATLLPWRTVLDNITYGLDLRGVPKKEAKRKVEKYLDLVQLRGFEHFHPGALSGGMQQRVNLARALVTDPHLLLLDEPFAALDAITREAMQNELLSIWDQTRKTVLMVTHQIDEAVLLSDRVIVFSNRPARIIAEIKIGLPRPRTAEVRYNAAFDELVKNIFSLIHKSAGNKAGWFYEV